MKSYLPTISILFFISLTNCSNFTMLKKLPPPTAHQKPSNLTLHEDIRTDNFYWLNDRDNPEVISYLEDENNYYDVLTSHTNDLKDSLFTEMKSRIKEDDNSVPYKYNGYWYVTKFEEGKDYPIYARYKNSLSSKEEILLDCNKMAEGHAYFNLVGISVSPDNSKVTFGVDTVGRRLYNIKIKNLTSGELYEDSIENTTGRAVWANDNNTLYYTVQNKKTLRSETIYKHILGTESSSDSKVFYESDDTFGVEVYKSKSQQYIVIQSYSTLTSEIQILDADRPQDTFKLFQARSKGLEYNIYHFEDIFYILTNADDADNFKLMKTPITATEKNNWKDVIPHRKDVLLESIDVFKDYLVVSERINGLNKIKISNLNSGDSYYLPFDNETYSANTTYNVDFYTKILRYAYNSLTTPNSIIDFNMQDQKKTIQKEQQVLGGKFSKDNYTSKRIWATAADGVKVAISMVHHKDTTIDSNTPLLLYAYGSYGYTLDPWFSSVRLSLLDRGFIFAIAHVRGGEYLGRDWYESGKLLNKKNTFTDFISCSEFLINQNYTSASHLYAMGGSAGGLLMGVVVNEAAKLYNGVIAEVPFVDVVTTMLDDSIPLTTGEYDEWGNPNDKKYYDYIKSYSPYDNVTNQTYPNLLVTTGLHDSQVQYWEPAKWVAKLRTMDKNNNLIFLKTNMDAGHGGASGRFEGLKEIAVNYAFLLDLEGISD